MSFVFGNDDPPVAQNPTAVTEQDFKFQNPWIYTPSQTVQTGRVGQQNQFVPTSGQGPRPAVRVVESPFEKQMRVLRERAAPAITKDILFGQDVADRADLRNLDPGVLAESTFRSGMEYLQPGFDDRRRRTEQMLSDRGLPINSTAYKEAVGDMNRAEDDATRRLALESVQSGRAEQSRLFNLQSAERANALSEISTLLGGGAFSPTQVAVPSASGVSVNPAFNNQLAAQNAAFQANQQRNNSLASGLFGLGGSLGAAALLR